MIQHIFLDLDGVLVDFVSSALRLFDAEDIEIPEGNDNIPEWLGISVNEFYKRIDAAGSAFWAEMEPYPWTEELIDYVSSIADWSILTSPTISPSCAKGKIAWLNKHLTRNGYSPRNFFISPQKHLLARPDRLLIDDMERNVKSFSEAGGLTITFPRPWNSQCDFTHSPLGYTKVQLEQIQNGVLV